MKRGFQTPGFLGMTSPSQISPTETGVLGAIFRAIACRRRSGDVLSLR